MDRTLVRPRHLRAGVPSAVTLAGMFCGFLSMAQTLDRSYVMAAWLIAIGGVLDACDGPVARRLGVAGKFGMELDSFTDLVTFGLAPALLCYSVYFHHWGAPGLLLGFLPAAATTIRLARYNLTEPGVDREYFQGFTSTASGCLLASFILFTHDLARHVPLAPAAAALVILSSILMISGVPYMSIGKYLAGGVWKTPQGTFWIPIGLIVLIFPAKALFPALLTVMFQGPLGPKIEPVLHHLQHMPGLRR
jgi:CDP-diacylglycerol--serine O-phosphatidyltransferase